MKTSDLNGSMGHNKGPVMNSRYWIPFNRIIKIFNSSGIVAYHYVDDEIMVYATLVCNPRRIVRIVRTVFKLNQCRYYYYDMDKITCIYSCLSERFSGTTFKCALATI